MPVHNRQVSIGPDTSPPAASRSLHRISQVRQEQGVSLRTAARQLGEQPSRLKEQEQEAADLTLSQLYAWQQLLDVPVSDLLVESDGSLSQPVLRRTQLLRLMKTAVAMQETADSPSVRRMAENLVNQLIEIMPELREVSGWHSVGTRRSQDEYGIAYQRRLSDEAFGCTAFD